MMQVNSDGTIQMMDGVTLKKDDFLRLVGTILQQLGTTEVPKPPPPPVEVTAIEEATQIRTRYKFGDYTGEQLKYVIENFKVKYPERTHFLINWILYG